MDVDAIKERFHDMAGGGSKLKTSTVGILLRNVGLSPSEAQLKKFIEEEGTECDEAACVKFAETIVLTQKLDTMENLCKVFNHYDPGNTGKVAQATFRNILTTFGEPLSVAEMDEVLKDACDNADPIDYKQFLTKILQ